VEECTGDVTTPSAGFAKNVSLAIGKFDERFVAARRDQRRVMKFVPSQNSTL
jgi:hypothetical protein